MLGILLVSLEIHGEHTHRLIEHTIKGCRRIPCSLIRSISISTMYFYKNSRESEAERRSFGAQR